MASPDPIKERTITYWVTREIDADGKLSDKVDVWTERPDMIKTGSWRGSGEIGLETHDRRWTIQECIAEIRIYPETGRECICIGSEVNEVKDD